SLIQATDLGGPDGGFGAHQLPERHAVHPQDVERLEIPAGLIRETHDHRDLPVEVDEVGCMAAAHVSLDRLCDGPGLDAEGGGTFAVDLDPDLGLPELHTEPDVREGWDLRQPALQCAGVIEGPVQVVSPNPNRQIRLAAAEQAA